MKIRNKGAPVLAIAAMILAGSPDWHPAAAQEDPGEDPIQTMPIPGMAAPGGQWGNPGMQLDPRYGQQFAPQAPYGGPAGGPMVAPGYGGWGQRATPIEIPYIARPEVGQPAGPGYGQGGYGAPQFQAPGGAGPQADPRLGQGYQPAPGYGQPSGGAPGGTPPQWGQRATPIEIPYIARPQVGQPAGPGYGQGSYGAPQFQAPGDVGPQMDPRYGQAPVGGYGTAPYGVLPLPEPNRR